MFLLEHYAEELSSPADENSVRLGYIVGKNQRLTVSSNSNLDEIYSSAKNGQIVLWAEPNIRTKGKAKESTSSIGGESGRVLTPCWMAAMKV